MQAEHSVFASYSVQVKEGAIYLRYRLLALWKIFGFSGSMVFSRDSMPQVGTIYPNENFQRKW
jgi:hypothetical protein